MRSKAILFLAFAAALFAHVSYQVILPPGSFHAFKYERDLMSVTQFARIPLPDEALAALKVTPPLWKDKLEETFYLLMKSDVSVGEDAHPAFVDLNGDGLQDLVLTNKKGEVFVFENVGSSAPAFVKTDPSKYFSPLPSGTDLVLSFGDLNGDGLPDAVALKSDGTADFYLNKGNSTHARWVHTRYRMKGLPKSAASQLVDMNGDGRADLVVGSGEQISLYTNEATESASGFVMVKEKAGKGGYKGSFPMWPKADGSSGIMVGEGVAPAFGDLNGDGLVDMIVGNKDGKLFAFYNIGTREKPSWKEVELEGLDRVKLDGRVYPAIVNLNNDELPDLVIGSSDGKLYYALNVGSAERPIFRVWNSESSKSWLAKFLWGSGYWDDLQKVTYFDPKSEYVRAYAQLILSTDEKYLDEVTYIIANAFPEDLKTMYDKGLQDMYKRLPAAIYKIAPKLKYVRIVEEPPYTTLEYRSEDGRWKRLPKEIYYEYVVMPNRYVLRPAYYNEHIPGYLFNEYLPYDKTYGKSLLEVVKDAETVHDAVIAISKWIALDIKAMWHTGPKPRGWYKIYHNLTNEKAGIWCGEFSIIVEAMARSVLIPTTVIVALGEDHQFNQYYDDGWKHWDQSSLTPDNWEKEHRYRIGNEGILIRYTRPFSWPMSWEQNGRYDYIHHTPLLYKEEEKSATVKVKVTDSLGRPIDGAQIVVWSHWPLEANYIEIPLPAAITYTDQSGVAEIKWLAQNRTYTISVLTPVGIKFITTVFKEHAVYNFDVVMDKPLPVRSVSYKQPTTALEGELIHVKVEYGLLKTVNWLYTTGSIYRQISGKVRVYVMDEKNYEKFLRGEEFEVVDVFEGSEGFIRVPKGYYVVVSNLDSAHAFVKVDVEM